MTSEVSLLLEKVGYIGAGVYTEIVAIDAPSSAVAGNRVDVTIRIRNKYSASVHVSAIGVYDSEERFIDWLDYWISPGATYSFSGSFIMPSRDVTIYAESRFEGIDGLWYYDDEAVKDVKLGEVVGWQLLDSRALAVALVPPVVGWQPLDSRSIAVKSKPPVVGWQVLDSKTVAVKSKPPVVGWQVLDEKTVNIAAGPPAVAWELLEETIYPYAYVYDGPYDGGIFTFKSDPFTPADWIAGKFAEVCEDEVRKAGGRVLETRVYVDKSPLLWTDWRIEIVGISPEVTAGTAISVGIAWWAAILIVILGLIALIVTATWAWKQITGEYTHQPISPEIKATWSRETLISAIGDFQTKLEETKPEFTPKPPEEIEAMSDDELRDYCDQLAEWIVPPPPPWGILGLAVVGGLGILGLGAAVALAARPKE